SERLEDEVDHAGTKCLYSGIQIGICGHENHVGEEADRPLLGELIETVFSGHHVIEDHDIEMPSVEPVRRFLRIRRFLDRLTTWSESLDQEVPHPRLIINDQN
ncbi:MAG TPA: hypothetical protein VN647_08350, partial [Nitrospira sp.]|nr:hypothetical protein [Nitrospira sp.]